MKSRTSCRKASSSGEKDRSISSSRLICRLLGGADRLVMPDHFLDDEAQKLLRKIRIQLGSLRQRPEAGDLYLFARRIGGGEAMLGLIFAHRLGAFEALGQQVHQSRINIVDAVSQSQKFWIGPGHVALFVGPRCGLP